MMKHYGYTAKEATAWCRLSNIEVRFSIFDDFLTVGFVDQAVLLDPSSNICAVLKRTCTIKEPKYEHLTTQDSQSVMRVKTLDFPHWNVVMVPQTLIP
jgi:hypothetical protein